MLWKPLNLLNKTPLLCQEALQTAQSIRFCFSHSYLSRIAPKISVFISVSLLYNCSTQTAKILTPMISKKYTVYVHLKNVGSMCYVCYMCVWVKTISDLCRWLRDRLFQVIKFWASVRSAFGVIRNLWWIFKSAKIKLVPLRKNQFIWRIKEVCNM